MKKILIIKIGAIGDVAMSLSMIDAAKRQFGDVHITWVCGKIVAPLLREVGNINNLIVLDDKNLLTGTFSERLNEIYKCWKELAFQYFDIVAIPYFDKRYHILTLPVKKGELRYFNSGKREHDFIRGRYYASEYAKLIDEVDNWKMRTPVIPKLSPMSKVLSLFPAVNEKRIVITPGGAKNLLNPDNLRRWPVEYYRELANYFTQKKYQVIITGSETDKWVNDYFYDLDVVNLVEKTSLTDMIALFNYADLLITHDTGALHLSKLADVKVLGLFGPTDPKTLIDLNNSNYNYLYIDELPCSPCFNGKTFANCDNNICMKNISTIKVIEKAEELLQ